MEGGGGGGGGGGIGDIGRMPESYEISGGGGGRRSRDEEHESRSGSDNMDGGASGDDPDADDGKPPRKKRYHRHTPQQIQELEAYNYIVFFSFLKLVQSKRLNLFSWGFSDYSKSAHILMKNNDWNLAEDYV